MRQGCSCVLRTILLHRTTWVVPRNPVSVHRCQLPKKFAATLTFFWLVGIAWKNSGLPLYTFAATTSTIIGSRPQTRVKNNKNRIRWAAGSCRGGGIRKKKKTDQSVRTKPMTSRCDSCDGLVWHPDVFAKSTRDQAAPD